MDRRGLAILRDVRIEVFSTPGPKFIFKVWPGILSFETYKTTRTSLANLKASLLFTNENWIRSLTFEHLIIEITNLWYDDIFKCYRL